MSSLSVWARLSLRVNATPTRRHLCCGISSVALSTCFHTSGPRSNGFAAEGACGTAAIERDPAVAPSAVGARVADIGPDNQRPRSPKCTALMVRAAHLGLRARPQSTSASWATGDEFAFYLWQLPWKLYTTLRRIGNDARAGRNRDVLAHMSTKADAGNRRNSP
ncbi:hypothetical protein MRX96_034367 [Rhipicephalus microplus]